MNAISIKSVQATFNLVNHVRVTSSLPPIDMSDVQVVQRHLSKIYRKKLTDDQIIKLAVKVAASNIADKLIQD